MDNAEEKFVTLNSYDASASQYAENTADLHPKVEAEKFMRTLPAHASVLDVGCGPGRDAKVFSNVGFKVTGIDFSPKMIEVAKQNAPGCSFQVMDIEHLDFSPESFHAVWANCVLLHIPKKNIPAVLDKIHAILKPQGSLYLAVKQSAAGESFETDSRYGGIRKFWSYFEPEELVKLLSMAKFHIVDLYVVQKNSGYDTHPIINVLAGKS